MNPDRHPELHQVLRGLASNREPGWNFPANFLELSFDEVAQDSARLSLEPGGHCIDVDGQVNLAAICVLADIGMGASMRRQLTVAGRSATVSMSLQFTGAARIGRLNLQGKLEGFVQRSVATQGLTRALIFAGDTLLCSASGTFVALGNREGLAPLPMRGREDYAAVCALHPSELTDGELAVYTRAKLAAESMDDGSRSSGKPSVDSFFERFWSLLPQRTDGGAVCHFDNCTWAIGWVTRRAASRLRSPPVRRMRHLESAGNSSARRPHT